VVAGLQEAVKVVEATGAALRIAVATGAVDPTKEVPNGVFNNPIDISENCVVHLKVS
jgi:hypothetical protein